MATLFKKKNDTEIILVDKKSRKKIFSFFKPKLKKDNNDDFQDDFFPNETLEVEDSFGKSEDNESKEKKNEKKDKLQFKSITRNRFTFGVISIVISLIIGFVLVPLSNTISSTKTINIVRAKEDINKGSIIQSSMLQNVAIPIKGIQDNVVTSADDIVGKFAIKEISNNENILKSKVSEMLPSGDANLVTLDKGHYAMSITLKSYASSVSGKLAPGDIVSLYANLNSNDEKNIYSYQPPELSYVKVLSISNEDIGNINADTDNTSNVQKIDYEIPTTITLELINKQQTELLAGLEVNSQVHFALVCRNTNNDYATELLNKQNEYFKPLNQNDTINEEK